MSVYGLDVNGNGPGERDCDHINSCDGCAYHAERAQERLETYREERESARDDRDAMRKQLDAKSADLSQLATLNRDLTERLREARTELEAVRKERDGLAARHTDETLRQKAADLQTSKVRIVEQLNVALAERDTLAAQLAACREALEGQRRDDGCFGPWCDRGWHSLACRNATDALQHSDIATVDRK